MVDVAEVKLWGELMGAVRWDAAQQLGYFEYHPDFLRTNWDVSPIKMPLSNGRRIYSFPELRMGRGETEDTFKGLPALLSDALPDKYGNRLINAWLAQNGRLENSMNPVETLCFIGSRGMGALEFEPSQMTSGIRSFSVEVDGLVEIAKKMLNHRDSFHAHLNEDEQKSMMEILKIGTSAGGARPKAVIAYNEKTGEVRSGQGNVPKGFEHWMIKLDGVSGEQFGESTGWGRVEYAYSLMAADCGIEMMHCRLLEENGRAHFMTRRFDRLNNEKLHVQSLCGLQHYNFNEMQSFSYEQVFQTMRLLRLTYPEAEQMFRRMVFNVLAVNYDDHTKNFSFSMDRTGKWRLAPAYDVCFAYDATNHWVNQQTLSIQGKRKGITESDLLSIAKANSIKTGAVIINQIKEVVHAWSDYAAHAGVRPDLSEKIKFTLSLMS